MPAFHIESKLDPESKELVKYAMKGMNYSAISRATGVRYAKVRKRLHSLGVTPEYIRGIRSEITPEEDEAYLERYGVSKKQMRAIIEVCEEKGLPNPRDCFRTWKKNRKRKGGFAEGDDIRLLFVHWWEEIRPFYHLYGKGKGKYQVTVIDPFCQIDENNIKAVPCEVATTPTHKRKDMEE